MHNPLSIQSNEQIRMYDPLHTWLPGKFNAFAQDKTVTYSSTNSPFKAPFKIFHTQADKKTHEERLNIALMVKLLCDSFLLKGQDSGVNLAVKRLHFQNGRIVNVMQKRCSGTELKFKYSFYFLPSVEETNNNSISDDFDSIEIMSLVLMQCL